MVKEGYWYGLPLLLAAGGLMGLRLYVASAFFIILALLVLIFSEIPTARFLLILKPSFLPRTGASSKSKARLSKAEVVVE